ncbi:hypothetical protein PIROE2DRAFT_13995 [Piromyces sp. E2]|nr:hypothetical protein PIROE2DRAFT_13995 [Piromyces sp. E2]|eukprot:OUM60279.1 hypothetical protein PIROE2DRAFT_13995 [Piromyces sp. E2]
MFYGKYMHILYISIGKEDKNKNNNNKRKRKEKEFGLAWWLFIDTYLWDSNKNQNAGDMKSIVSFIPGILGTVGVNMIPRSSMSSDLFGKEMSTFRRFIMLIAFSVTFSSLISSFWIFFSKYSSGNYTVWVGFVLMVQSVLIFISTYIFRFKRTIVDEYPQYYY